MENISLIEKLKENFNSKDEILNEYIALETLKLMHYCQLAINCDNNNMLLGRDLKGWINQQIIKLARAFNIINYMSTCEEIENFRKKLIMINKNERLEAINK